MPLMRPKKSTVMPRQARVYTEEEIQDRIADLPFNLQLVILGALENLLKREIRESLTSLTAARGDMRGLQSHVNGLVVEGFQETETAKEAAAAKDSAGLEDCPAGAAESSAGAGADDSSKPAAEATIGGGGDESTRPKSGSANESSTKPKPGGPGSKRQPPSQMTIQDEVGGKTSKA